MTITESAIAALPVPSISVAPINTVGVLCWVRPYWDSKAIANKATTIKTLRRVRIIVASLR